MSVGQLTKNAIKEIKGTYEVPDHHAFAMWALSVFHYESDLSESSLPEVYEQTYELLQEEGPGDLCLDGYFYDADVETLYLYQAKYTSTKERKAKPGIREAREVALALNALWHDCAEEQAEGSSRGKVAGFLGEVVENQGSIKLRAITSGKWAGFKAEAVLKNVDSKLRNIVEFEALDIDQIEEEASRASEDLSGKEVGFRLFSGTSDAVLIYPEKGVPGLGESRVFLIDGKSIGEAANSYGTKLFDQNVRTFLGKGRVNREIIEALQDKIQRDRFWYAHNGITLLCDGFSVDRDDDEKGDLITIKNPQIVNGCQTASSIGQVIKEGQTSLDDFAILTRVIMLKGDSEVKEEVSGYIAFGTNNQSPINEADLRANDPRQKFFEKILNNFDKPWFYERKRNAWKNLKKNRRSQAARYKGKPERVINRDLYQQAWRSYEGNPAHAITRKNEVWQKSNVKSGGLYERVFSRNRVPEHVVFVAKLFDWFSQVFSVKDGGSLCVELNKTLKPHITSLSQAKTLVAAHSVALLGYLAEKQYGEVESFPKEKAKKAIDSLDMKNYVRKNWGEKNWKVLEPEMRLIMATWSNYCIGLKNEEETLYRKLKNVQTFEELKALLDNVIESKDEPSPHFSSL